MRNHKLPIIIMGIIAILVCALVSVATAEDQVLTATVQSVMSSTTKTGDSYVRIIVAETKTLQGTEYTTGVPVMAFRDLASRGGKFSEGDELRAIVSPRTFEGKDSYLVRAWLN